MGFNGDCRLAERHIGADVHRGSKGRARHTCPRRIDAHGRQERGDAREVGRGKADGRTAAGAGHDRAGEAIGRRRQRVGVADAAGGDESPQPGTRHGLAVDDHRRHDLQFDAVAAAEHLQQPHVASPPGAEAEVSALDDPPGAEPAPQDGCIKGLGLERQEHGVRGLHLDGIDTEGE